jgi:O-antigen/teichoic acid export membrane protein
MSTIGRQLVKGAGWMVLLRFTDRLVGAFTFTILARLLSPEHFGLVALATSVIALAEMVSDVGVELALIRDPHSGRTLYNAAWTLKIGRGLAMGALYAVLAQPAATFFNEPRLEGILYCLAVAGLIGAWENIGVVEFRTSLAFAREFKYLFLSRCLPVPVTLGLAYTWRSYWALVGGILVQRVTKVCLSYWLHSYRPRISLAGIRALVNFSKWMAVQNVIQGLSQRAPAFVLGRLTNVTILGHFEVAFELATMATTELGAPIRRAFLPGFVHWSSDIEHLKKGVLDTYGAMVLVGLPIPVAMAVLAPLLVQTFLGEHWLPAVPALQVLAVYGVVQSLGTSSHLVYLALNRLRLMTVVSGFSLSVVVPFLLWGVSRWGAVGAGWALTVTAALVLCVDVSLVAGVLGVHRREFCRLAARPVLAASGMFLLLWCLPVDTSASVSFRSGLPRLLAFALAGLATYVGLLVICWRLCGSPESMERKLLFFVTEQWHVWRPRLLLSSGVKRQP